MATAEYDPLYLRGIELFNDCDFFESHEAWEELWTEYQGPSRKFYQGLIQAAVALHHFGNGNIRGAKKLYYTSLGYLEPYRPQHEGIDLDKFFAEMQQLLRRHHQQRRSLSAGRDRAGRDSRDSFGSGALPVDVKLDFPWGRRRFSPAAQA